MRYAVGMSFKENRRARRLMVSMPAVVQKLGPLGVPIHPALAGIYERVEPDTTDLGLSFAATVKDLSVNGVFVAGIPLPLLSRVALSFTLADFGQVEALGWVLWRRREDAQIPLGNGGHGQPVTLKAGIGILFEAVSLEARLAIARVVALVGEQK